MLGLNDVHPVFRYPCFEDVTRIYGREQAYKLSVGKDRFIQEPKEGEPVYLCMSERYSWKPVGGIFMTVWRLF